MKIFIICSLHHVSWDNKSKEDCMWVERVAEIEEKRNSFNRCNYGQYCSTFLKNRLCLCGLDLPASDHDYKRTHMNTIIRLNKYVELC
jgi:hypothetical protein